MPTSRQAPTPPQASNGAGQRVAELRGALGLTQEAFARKVGVAKAQVGQWETGVRRPGLESLAAIGRATGASFLWLALGEGGMWGQPTDRNRGLLEASAEAVLDISASMPNRELDLPAIIATVFEAACDAGMDRRTDDRAVLVSAVRPIAEALWPRNA